MATCVFACIGRTSLIARIEGISINGIEDKKDGLKVNAELRGCCVDVDDIFKSRVVDTLPY